MPDSAPKAIFLSYSRDDAAAARRIAEALRSAGLEVWFDANELTGGDAWDQKIRTQIADCALFLPLISANTESRLEGYFRLEWRLAEQRSHLMAKGKRFLVPVCIDDTREKGAHVPDAFLEVQWTRLPAGAVTPQFIELVERLVAGRSSGTQAPIPSPGPRTSPLPARKPAAVWIGAAAAVIVGVAALLFALRKPAPEPAVATSKPTAAATASPAVDKPTAPKTGDKSVAVLAFENLSVEKDNEYFSDGISDELLTQLGKVRGLRVAGRTSAFFFKGKNVPESEIAQKLNVAYVVTGTVQRSGNQVKITARLVSAADGFEVWSDRITEEMKDIFAVQEKVAGLIAQSLQLTLGATTRAARVVSPEAQRLVLEGRYHWNMRTDEGFTRAEAAFMKALEIDPNFAEAHAGLAGVYVIRANYIEMDGKGDRTADIRRARIEAQRALEIDPSLAEAHAVLGSAYTQDGRFAEAEQSFERALALNPNSIFAHHMRGQNLFCTGDLEVSFEEFRKAIALDPFFVISQQSLGFGLYFVHRLPEAADALDRAVAIRPDIFVPTHGYRVRLLLDMGKTSEALATARLIRQKSAVFPRWASDAYALDVLRRAGTKEEAAEYANELLARLPAESWVRGFVLSVLGRYDEAVPYLERTPQIYTPALFLDTIWDAYRENPKYTALVAKMGRTEEYKTARQTLARMVAERAAKK